jgi:hypothetical protein
MIRVFTKDSDGVLKRHDFEGDIELFQVGGVLIVFDSHSDETVARFESYEYWKRVES